MRGRARRARSIWAANRAATEGLIRARLLTAAFAIDEGDAVAAEAALERLPPGAPGVAEARARVLALKAARAGEGRRRLRLVAALAAAALFAGVAVVLGVRETRRGSEAEAANERRRQALALADGAAWKDAAGRIELYERALAADPSWREGHTELAGAHMDRAYDRRTSDPAGGAEDLEAARGVLDRLLAIAPDDAVALAWRGYASLMLGEKEPALADYRRVAVLAPETHDGLAVATVVALAEGRIADAERFATGAIERGADQDDFARRAIARFVLGDLAGGLDDVERGARLAPTDAY